MFEGLTVLFVEDDPAVRLGGKQALQLAGLTVHALESGEQALKLLVAGFPGILVTDVKMSGMDGLELLRRALEVDPGLPVILVTGHGDISMAVQAMRLGAYDFIEKPFSSELLSEVVQRALEKRGLTLEVQSLRQQLENRRAIEGVLLGRSPAIEALRRVSQDLADTDADVLVVGETGTGKELVARCLHDYSPRRGRHFSALNCGGVPETLFESEVFGHEAGAFTGAAKRRIGKIEYAQGGTLFLDEIETMPPVLQIKLLRTLQERVFERLGANEPLPMDCRIVAATKCDLLAETERGTFRPDLYYRLSVAVLEIPPLRERREDIPLLFEHFVLQAAVRYGREAPVVSTAQLQSLMAHHWPGNVRELRNVADRFVLGLTKDKLAGGAASGRRSLEEQLTMFERLLIEDALKNCSGRTTAASELLGLPRKTLYDKMHRLGLSTEDFKQG
ncbi:MAG: sigma-54 dependent transcriptional regulator [Pigmentiphaga sp.]|uniref:sigma-54-dependent transcriptional regulator n=1 Tax=Pigmentiphaga sp. TaxID=1977564 RepID=UPI0029BDDA66|nr:sigma-54 dependent transcriptional regulator [Pigmentiphaga sp.]MDX3907321.1 sigma-54 dependent transcriptional regulator [Pigmentiphaga sp.]